MKTRRFGPWKQWWASICSQHQNHDKHCHLCKHGTWIPVYANFSAWLLGLKTYRD